MKKISCFSLSFSRWNCRHMTQTHATTTRWGGAATAEIAVSRLAWEMVGCLVVIFSMPCTTASYSFFFIPNFSESDVFECFLTVTHSVYGSMYLRNLISCRNDVALMRIVKVRQTGGHVSYTLSHHTHSLRIWTLCDTRHYGEVKCCVSFACGLGSSSMSNHAITPSTSTTVPAPHDTQLYVVSPRCCAIVLSALALSFRMMYLQSARRDGGHQHRWPYNVILLWMRERRSGALKRKRFAQRRMERPGLYEEYCVDCVWIGWCTN